MFLSLHLDNKSILYYENLHTKIDNTRWLVYFVIIHMTFSMYNYLIIQAIILLLLLMLFNYFSIYFKQISSLYY